MLPACRASRCNHGDCRLITRLPGLPILMKTFIHPYELEKHVFFSYFGLLKVGMQTCLQVKVQKEGPEGRGMGGGRGGGVGNSVKTRVRRAQDSLQPRRTLRKQKGF